MKDARTEAVLAPTIECRRDPSGRAVAVLEGQWNLRGLSGQLRSLRRTLRRLQQQEDLHWDLTAIVSLRQRRRGGAWGMLGREAPGPP